MSDKNDKSGNKMTREERLANHLAELRSKMKLEGWNSFIENMKVPADMFPALQSGRSQLMPKGRAIDAEACQALYDIIVILLDTNSALREHTEQTALLVHEWMDSFKGMATLARHIEAFANLRDSPEDE